MSGAVAASVRVTVVSDTQRADLALPATVPLAELLPELTGRLGVAPETMVAGPALLTAGGRRLADSRGLAAQEVRDGAVLALATGADVLPLTYDDPVDAAAAVVAADAHPWSARDGRWAGWLAGGALLLLAVLGVAGGPLLAGCRAVVGRLADDAALAAGLLTGVVLISAALPTLAVAVSPLGHGRRAARVDLGQVAGGARVAHRVLLAGGVLTGVLVVGLAPLVAGHGRAGVVLAVAASIAVLLRSRHHRRRPEVAVGLATASLAAWGVACVVLLRAERPLLVVAVLVAVGVLAVIWPVLPGRDSLRRRRLADLAEGAVVLTLLPAFAVASGLFAAIAGAL